MFWKCMIAGADLPDLRADRKEAKQIERYLVSGRAVYVQGNYLPFTNVKSVRIQPSVYRPHHCCGMGVPVIKMGLDYGGEKPLVLMLEKQENAERLCAAVRAGNPDAVVELREPKPGERL